VLIPSTFLSHQNIYLPIYFHVIIENLKRDNMDAASKKHAMNNRRIKIVNLIPKSRGDLGNIGIDGRILLKWIFEKYGLNLWFSFNWFMIKKSTFVFY
jgi:hypothetical protein